MNRAKKTGVCSNCKITTEAVLHRVVMANNSVAYVWICSRCNKNNPFNNGPLYIAHEKVESFLTFDEIDALPMINMSMDRRCVRCLKRTSETHHWAPRAIFGEECEQWPKDYLCKECHDIWHKRVTPQLTR